MSQSETHAQSHNADTVSTPGATQGCQVFQAGKHTHVLPHCHRNSRHMG